MGGRLFREQLFEGWVAESSGLAGGEPRGARRAVKATRVLNTARTPRMEPKDHSLPQGRKLHHVRIAGEMNEEDETPGRQLRSPAQIQAPVTLLCCVCEVTRIETPEEARGNGGGRA
eukprot:3099061-Rhodomonas_salina.3